MALMWIAPVILVGISVAFYLWMSGWRVVNTWHGITTYLGYSFVNGQQVAGLAVRKRDMERAGVSLEGAQGLPAVLGVENPWIFRVLGDPVTDGSGSSIDWTAFAKLHLAEKDPADRMLLNEVPLRLHATQLNHVLSDWHISRSDSTGRELVDPAI